MILKSAYEAFDWLRKINDPPALDVATARIVAAVGQAKQAVLAEIGGVAAADVRACNDSVYADLENLGTMTAVQVDL